MSDYSALAHTTARNWTQFPPSLILKAEFWISSIHRLAMSHNLQLSILRLSVAETKVICWADADVCRAQRSECSFSSHHTFGLFDRSAYCELCLLSPAQTDVPETYICICHLADVNVTGFRSARSAIKGQNTRKDRYIIFLCVRAWVYVFHEGSIKIPLVYIRLNFTLLSSVSHRRSRPPRRSRLRLTREIILFPKRSWPIKESDSFMSRRRHILEFVSRAKSARNCGEGKAKTAAVLPGSCRTFS